MKWLKVLLIISLIASVNACTTIKEVFVPITIEFPQFPERPTLVNLESNGSFTIIQGEWIEKEYYIIYNPTTIAHYRHNYLILMNYSQRLEDYLDLIKKQNTK